MLLPMIGFAPGAASAWQSIDRQAAQPFQPPEKPAQVGAAPTAAPGGFLKGIFMPFVSRPTFSIRGRVTDGQGQPLSGVTLIDQTGRMVTTDGEGAYAFTDLTGTYAIAPSLDGHIFSPSMTSNDSAAGNSQQNFTALAAAELIANGGFETNEAWELPVTEHTAIYTSEGAHSGTRSVLTGIAKTGQNTYSYSSVRQLIDVPAGAASATLTLWLYPFSTEAASAPQPAKPAGPYFADSALTSDAQYVLVLNQNNVVLDTLLWMRSSNQQWSLHTFNLSKYAGKKIKLHIGSFNDGYDGITGLYVDDVSVSVSTTGGTPISEATPTPTPTPGTPPTCTNLVGNSSFEHNGYWSIPDTEHPAAFSADQALTGTRSLRTGILKPSQNRYSYSDAFQTVAIPASATGAKLGMWIYPVSTEPANLAIASRPALNALFSSESLTGDIQYVLVMDPDTFAVQETLLWQRSNAQTWTYQEFNLKKYAGKTVRIQIGTTNSGAGGITAMYVDDVILDTCGTAPVPTPTPGPTATPDPAQCTEKLGNTSFENGSDWEIPITAFSAGFSTDRAHTGARSMRAGITAVPHNRYSFSDFRQGVTIPKNTTKAALTLWLFPSSGEAASLVVPQRPTGNLLSASALASDIQYLLVLDAYGNWIDTLIWQRSNAQAWTSYTFDLTSYAGSTIQLQFGAFNDGWNGVTSLYVDDVSLQVCP
jgi:hypothetical protein